MAIFVRALDRPQPRTGEALGSVVAVALMFVAFQASLSSAGSAAAPLGFVLGVFAPFPLILRRIKGGLGSALLTSLLAGALLATWSPPAALRFVFFVACPGVLMGEAVARGRGLPRGCLWAFGLLAAEFGVKLLFDAPQMAAFVTEPFVRMASPQFGEYMRSQGTPLQAVDGMAEWASLLLRVIPVIYPALYLIFGALVVLANAALLRAYLARRDPGWLEGGEFEGIRWPLAIAVVFVLSGLAVGLPSLRAPAYNVLLLVAFFFALQGLAIVVYFAHRLAGPPILRLAVLLLVLMNPWGTAVLSFLGLFDTFFDFRKYAEVPPETQ